ncbi:MAG: hypothetical protein ACRCXT_22010 [Paraclostridium sp.]
MKKIITLLFSCIVTALLVFGCGSKDIEDYNIDEIASEEAKKITDEQGYTLKSEALTESDILIGDSEVFELIKEASIKGGYLEADFESMSEDRKVVGYELVEKSNEDGNIMLCMVIDKGKVIGAYLDYAGYMPGIEPINLKNQQTVWNMQYIQGKDGEIIYTSNENKDIYPDADIKNISCVLQEPSITIKDEDTDEEWVGNCKIIEKDRVSIIYELKFDNHKDNDKTGNMVKSFTKYNDNTHIDTLIISYGEYSLNLTYK